MVLGNNMKQFKFLHEVIDNVPSDLQAEIEDTVNEFRLSEDIAGEFEFETYFGGDVYYIETLDDLKEIPTHVINHDTNEWDNLLNTYCSYDIAEYVCGGQYVFILDIISNAGGPSYYIPRQIADKCCNVQKSINETQPLRNN
jgi:hypothetical protein